MARTPNIAADTRVANEMSQGVSGASFRPSSATKRAETLAELEAQFVSITTRFQVLFEAAGSDLCTRAPTPGAWSAVECVRHLSLSADAYFPVWQQVIAHAGPRKAEMNAAYAIDFWGRLLSWILEPPARIRSKALLGFEPGECESAAVVLDEFISRQERIIAALHRCRGRAIDQVRIASPADARIRYSIWSSFVINAAHQRRHLWQAEQAIKALQSAK